MSERSFLPNRRPRKETPEYRYYTDGYGLSQVWRWDGADEYTYKTEYGGRLPSHYSCPQESMTELDIGQVPEWAR